MDWVSKFWSHVNKKSDDECWEWAGRLNAAGYGLFHHIYGHPQRAHRIAYELSVGPIPDGLILCHKCDNRKCVNPNHMFPGTRDDNQKDMGAKGRAAWGIKNAMAKLTPQQVLEILERGKTGETQASIANDYSVGQTAICKILRREYWTHLGGA